MNIPVYLVSTREFVAMFISILDLFKIGIGPSSSHTMGPIVAAENFMKKIKKSKLLNHHKDLRLQCILKGSLSFTGIGHATDKAVALGLHGYTALELAEKDVDGVVRDLWGSDFFYVNDNKLLFSPEKDILFDRGDPLPQHPNGMIFRILSSQGEEVLSETCFSVGGGFIATACELAEDRTQQEPFEEIHCPFPFVTAREMLRMGADSNQDIAAMKYQNELCFHGEDSFEQSLKQIWQAMQSCVEHGLAADGILPGGLFLKRRAKKLLHKLQKAPQNSDFSDYLCAYAMAVGEENASGHMVVTAPTNGAAGVIPAILYYISRHEGADWQQIRKFMLTSAAIGGLIKNRSSISGAEVGCQGEIGSAAAMAAAGLCAVRGGSPAQVENAAEIALEHHLGVTCDPVKGLVQVPCIERNAFGAVKAWVAASLALRGEGNHFMPLDGCIQAMKETGLEMSDKYKETSLGGLAVSYITC